MLTLYYFGEKPKGASAEGCRRRTGGRRREKLSGGGIIIPGGRRWAKNSKKNSVSKTVAQCRKNPIPYLYTLSRTIPYLYTLNQTIPYLNTLSRTIPYLNTLRKHANLAQNQILVGSQSKSRTLKTLQSLRIEYNSAEPYPILIHGCGTLLGPGCESAAIAYLNTWRVPTPRLISSHSYYYWDFDWWTQPFSCWKVSVWIRTYIKNGSSFQNFRTLGIETQDTKPTVLPSRTLLQVEYFRLRPKWKIWVLYFRIKLSSNKEENQHYLVFSVFPQSRDQRWHFPVEVSSKYHPILWPRRTQGSEKRYIQKQSKMFKLHIFK